MNKLRAIILLMTLLAAGCGHMPAQPGTSLPAAASTIPVPANTPTLKLTPAASGTNTQPAPTLTQPAKSPTATTPVTALPPLNPKGPWFFDGWRKTVFSLDGGSAELKKLNLPGSFNHFAAAPKGGWIAVKPGPQSGNPWSADAEIQILLYQLPNLEPIQTIDLLGDQAKDALRQYLASQTYIPFETKAANGLFFDPNMDWSPSGRYLAFAGALDGPSMDVYIYDTVTNKHERLTSGKDQAILMGWSPDEKWIIHAAAESVSDMGFHALRTVWAVNRQNGQTILLYAARGGRESILGWTGPDTFVVQANSFETSLWGLSRVDINGPTLQPLLESEYDGAALDPISGTILIEINGGLSGMGNAIPKGIYRVKTASGTLEPILTGAKLSLLNWYSELQAFAVDDREQKELILINTKGEVVLRIPRNEDYGRPIPSPDGQYVIIDSSNIYSAKGVLAAEMGGSRLLYWFPDSSGLISQNSEQGTLEVRLAKDGWLTSTIERVPQDLGCWLVNP